jgi:hypothetical protein
MVIVVLGFKLRFAVHKFKISGYGVIPCSIIWLIRFGRLKVAKKSAKRSAPARKKGMKKAKPAKRAKARKRPSKPAPAPMAPPQPTPAPPTLGGMTDDQ